MTNNQFTQEKIRRIAELLKHYDVAMLTTIQPRDGSLHSRPMVAQAGKFDGQLWFYSRFNSSKIDEIRAGSQVNLAYVDPDGRRYLSISGTAFIERDRNKIKALWSEIYRAWFPRGLDEPDLALLCVNVTEAEIWDAASYSFGERIRFES